MAELSNQSLNKKSRVVKRPVSFSTSITKVNIFSLSKGDVKMIIFTFLVIIGISFFSMLIQIDQHKAERAIQNYETQRLALQAQTDKILNEISEQYNYQSIKQAAKDNQMTIESARVRTVE